MNVLMTVLQHAEEAGETPGIFDLSVSVSFWTVIIFLVLLGVLLKYAFPPILGYAEAREKRIQANLDEAKQSRAEAERLLADQRAELVEARRHSKEILADARQAGERVRQDMLERARVEQDELLARARQDIERERQRAVEAVRREAVELALAAASRLLDQRLTAEEDRKIVTDYLGRVEPSGETAGVA